MPSTSDVTHLLRRTEFVARPGRVAELAALPSLAAAVDNVLAVPSNPPPLDPDPAPLPYQPAEHAQRIVKVTNTWLDRMAHDSPRPMQEKIALFWHGHFVSDDAKAGYTKVIAEQLDLYRAKGLGNLRTLAIEMSTTVAMLRYLDNNQNFADAPNQNFGRELLELFLLGVGNYTEADVEACTRAWTGHTVTNHADNTGTHTWVPGRHDHYPKTFLGVTINSGDDWREHGADTIRAVLGNGKVPAGAAINRGRPTKEVAAEFLSRKLWRFFAGTEPSSAVVGALRTAALDANFSLKPWLRALLTHPEFYTSAVRRGLVRAPADYLVALLAASGVRAAEGGNPFWLQEGMGQRLLFPPNVSGWGHNGYYVSASAFGQRAAVARHVAHFVLADYWEGAGMRLAGGRLTRAEVEAYARSDAGRVALVGRILELMGVGVGAVTRAALDEFALNAHWSELHDLIALVFVSPEMNVA